MYPINLLLRPLVLYLKIFVAFPKLCVRWTVVDNKRKSGPCDACRYTRCLCEKFEQTSDNCCSIDIVTHLNNLKFPKHKEVYVVFSENWCNASAEDKNLVRTVERTPCDIFTGHQKNWTETGSCELKGPCPSVWRLIDWLSYAVSAAVQLWCLHVYGVRLMEYLWS